MIPDVDPLPPDTPACADLLHLHPSFLSPAESAVDPIADVEPVPPLPAGLSAGRGRGLAGSLRRPSWEMDKREKLWREACRPGDGAKYNLMPIGLFALAGSFLWLLLLASVSKPASNIAPVSPPATPHALPGPRSAAVLLGRVAPPGGANELEWVSEAEDDSTAAMAAGAWQLDTDYRLSQLDMRRVWNLNNRWRPPLNEFQDTLIGLASLASRGGSWVGHELCRNDLTLESELIAPQAMALSASVPDDDPTAGTGTPQHVERAAQWEALWRKIHASADAHVRASADLEDFWKSRLDDVLEHVRKAHQALLPLFCDMADDLAAQAVVRYFDQYFTDNFATSTTDGDEQK